MIPGLPDVGKILPDLFENLEVFRFPDQLDTPRNVKQTLFFCFLVGTLRGVDPSKKMRNVRTIHFHPVSR